MQLDSTHRTEKMSDYLMVNMVGEIIVKGKKNPTDEEIASAVREFAKNFGKDANSVGMNDSFKLSRPNPMISHQKGTSMTKAEWIAEYGWNDEEFEIRRSSGILSRN